MNSALNPPTAGTSPHNEISARHARDHGQRDDREATMAYEELQRQPNGLPDGFRWGKTAAGKPMIVPTRDAVLELHELVVDTFEAKDARYEEMPENTKITKSLTAIQREFGKVNDFLANGLAYQLARAYASEFAGALNWVKIHATQIQRHQDNGNEDGAENSLINLESSRTQAFMIGQILDWCVDNGAQVDLMKGTESCLNLAGWRLMNQQASTDRKAVQRTTRDMLWSKSPKQPDEELEASEEELDEAFG